MEYSLKMNNRNDMRYRWNRRITGSILAPNPTGLLINRISRIVKYKQIKKQRKLQ